MLHVPNRTYDIPKKNLMGYKCIFKETKKEETESKPFKRQCSSIVSKQNQTF